MRIYKFVVLWMITVLSNVVFANLLDTINNITTVVTNETDVFSTGNFVTPNFTVTINNNHTNGYTITARSTNGSKFNLAGGDPNQDGQSLEYQFNCSGVTLTDTTFVPSTGLQTLTSDVSGTVMLSVPNPSSATSDEDMTCTCQLISGETVSELFAGTYNDTVTIDINLL